MKIMISSNLLKAHVREHYRTIHGKRVMVHGFERKGIRAPQELPLFSWAEEQKKKEKPKTESTVSLPPANFERELERKGFAVDSIGRNFKLVQYGPTDIPSVEVTSEGSRFLHHFKSFEEAKKWAKEEAKEISELKRIAETDYFKLVENENDARKLMEWYYQRKGNHHMALRMRQGDTVPLVEFSSALKEARRNLGINKEV